MSHTQPNNACYLCRFSAPPSHRSLCHHLRHRAAPPRQPTSVDRARRRWLDSVGVDRFSKGYCLRGVDSPLSSVPLGTADTNPIESEGGPVSFVVPFIMVNYVAAGVERDYVLCLLIIVAKQTLVPQLFGKRVTRSPVKPRVFCLKPVRPSLLPVGLNWHQSWGRRRR